MLHIKIVSNHNVISIKTKTFCKRNCCLQQYENKTQLISRKKNSNSLQSQYKTCCTELHHLLQEKLQEQLFQPHHQ